MGFTLNNPPVIGIIKQIKANFFTTKKGKKYSMERKKHPSIMSKSVPFSLFKYDTIMTNTRRIYFNCYPFVYNIQVKTFFNICWQKCILGLELDHNAAFAVKWLKMYNFAAFTAFLSKLTTFAAFTAFEAERLPCKNIYHKRKKKKEKEIKTITFLNNICLLIYP